MPKHDADIRGRLAIVYNGETVTSKTNASNPQVGGPCHTLGATGAGRAVVIENHAKAFSFDSLASNSMKSTNPHSGCREVGVHAKTRMGNGLTFAPLVSTRLPHLILEVSYEKSRDIGCCKGLCLR